MPNTQVIQSPSLYTNNLQVSYASTTTLSVAAGQKRDNTNVADMFTSTATTVSIASTGANALDTGTIAASTVYYLHMIFNSKAPATVGAFVLSLSATAPTLPAGYDVFALHGYMITTAGSVITKFYTTGAGSDRSLFWDTSIATALTTGSPGTVTGTPTAVSLAVGVPPIDGLAARLTVNYVPATAGDQVVITPGASAATVGPRVIGSVAAKANSGQLLVVSKLITSVPSVMYNNSAASGATAIWIDGFDYSV